MSRIRLLTVFAVIATIAIVFVNILIKKYEAEDTPGFKEEKSMTGPDIKQPKAEKKEAFESEEEQEPPITSRALPN